MLSSVPSFDASGDAMVWPVGTGNATTSRTQPALIVNPKATRADLLAWCADEANHLATVAELTETSRDDVDFRPAEIAALVAFRARPLAAVLIHMFELENNDGSR